MTAKPFWLTLALAVPATGAGLYAVSNTGRAVEPLVTASVPSEIVQQGLALSEPVPAPPARPVFDVVHAAPDGSLTVAGRARPNEPVTIERDGTVLGNAVPNGDGAFVFTSERGEGRFVLRLRQGDRASAEVAAVERDGGAAVAVLTAPLLPSVSVEAVEVVDDATVVAGAAPPGGTVRLYLDGALLGQTEATEDGRFLLDATGRLKPGRRTVRAEIVAPSGTVLARAETAVLHELDADETSDEPGGEGTLRTGTAIIIREGDSLWRIAQRTYGRGTRFSRIFEANREQIVDPDRIFAGQVFRLPDVETVPGG